MHRARARSTSLVYGLAWCELRLGASARSHRGGGRRTSQEVSGKTNWAPGRPLCAPGWPGRPRHEYGPAADDLQIFLRTAGKSPGSLQRPATCSPSARLGLSKPADATSHARSLAVRDDPKYAMADKAAQRVGLVVAVRRARRPKRRNGLSNWPTITRPAAWPPKPYFNSASMLLNRTSNTTRRAYKAYYAAMNKAGKSELGESAAHKLGFAYYQLRQI